MADVFISYSSVDREQAALLASCLDAAGFDVWWDRELLGGSAYGDEIYRKLEEAHAIIVLWSESAIDSEWVLKEATFGKQAGKLIPVRLDSVLVPEQYRDFHILDFSNWSGKAESNFRLLARSIRAKSISSSEPAIEIPKAGWRFSKFAAGVTFVSLCAILLATYGLFNNSEARKVSDAYLSGVQVPVRGAPPLDRRAIRNVLSILNVSGYPSDVVVEALIISGSLEGAFDRLESEFEKKKAQLSLSQSRELLHQMAVLAMYRNEDKAEDIYREIELFDSGDRVALTQLAKLAARKGDFDRSRSYINRAIALPAYSEEDRINTDLLYLRLSSLWEQVPVEKFYLLGGEAQKAGYETVYARALTYAIARELDIDLLPQERNAQSSYLNLLFDKLKPAIIIQENSNEVTDLNLSYSVASRILDKLDQDEERLEYLEKSLQIGKVIGSDGDIILGHRNLARYYVDTKNLEKAKEHQSIIVKLRDTNEIARPNVFDYRLAAYIAHAEGKHDEACINLDKAKAQHDALFPSLSAKLEESVKLYACNL